MSIQDLGALGELLGSVAVLATLIYLAMQTRQNTQAIGAQLDVSRLGFIHATSLAQVTSNELLEALNEDRTDGVSASEARREMYWFAECAGHQWQFVQAQKGILPTFNERALAGRIVGLFATYRGFETWWEAYAKQGFATEFVEWVESERSKAPSR